MFSEIDTTRDLIQQIAGRKGVDAAGMLRHLLELLGDQHADAAQRRVEGMLVETLNEELPELADAIKRAPFSSVLSLCSMLVRANVQHLEWIISRDGEREGKRLDGIRRRHKRCEALAVLLQEVENAAERDALRAGIAADRRRAGE